MTKKLFVRQSTIANGLLDLVHTDICGPLSIPARGGFSYFITFTDDHSRYGYVYLMSTSLRPLEGSRNTDLKLKTKLIAKKKPFGRTEAVST
ncbi:UNVERIFIED_CONTAM: hypothetical protein Sradi_7142600 [Sesamum radiatum]|uniref:Uncharacterized protein n=1 Tax=Sesamum radiatum TaxID=300843 RepID=A0AAW2IWL5_SESRA